jgi:hypothetical protein
MKKRANELDEDFEYMAKDNNINDEQNNNQTKDENNGIEFGI